MPFGRFFDRGKSRPASAPEPVEPEPVSEDSDDADVDGDGETEDGAAAVDPAEWLAGLAPVKTE